MVIEYFLDWIDTAPVSKRIEAAGAMVRVLKRPDIDMEERENVEAALTTLLEDRSAEVRLRIAEELGAYAGAPRHIVFGLVGDRDDIAMIVLSRSPVFHDAELVDMIKSGTVEQQIAISCRPWLSAGIVDALCTYACTDACMGVLSNPVAELSGENLHCVAERFGNDTQLRTVLLEHPDLLAKTRLTLINKLGESLTSFVLSRGWVSENKIKNVVAESCDRAIIQYAAEVNDADVINIVRSIVEQGRMTASFLLRAVCMGNISLVACAFSELSGVKFSRVEAILTKDRRSAFKAVYDRAGLPSAAFSVFYSAISTWRRLLSSGSPINQSRLPFLVTREVLETYTGQKNSTVDELIVLLRRLSAEAARDSAKSKAMEIAGRNAPEVEEVNIDISEQDLIPDGFDIEPFAIEIELVEVASSILRVMEEVEQPNEMLPGRTIADCTADIVSSEAIVDDEMLTVSGYESRMSKPYFVSSSNLLADDETVLDMAALQISGYDCDLISVPVSEKELERKAA